MKHKLRAVFEATLLRVARYIVYNRNVQRCRVISRRDNNELFEMGGEIKQIEKRILTGYENE